MKLQYVSDLHVEFLSKVGTTALANSIMEAAPEASVLVLAGDIGTLTSGNLFTFLDTIEPRYDKVLYVFGNHEYYTVPYATSDTKQDLLDVCVTYPNLEVLDNRCIELNGKTIGGTTLWFDTFHPDSVLNMHSLNDFRVISGGWNFLREEELSAELFVRQLLANDKQLDLLITHHGVTPRVHPNWEGHKTNVFYFKDLTEYLKHLDIPFVIHGHQHTNHTYSVKCNSGNETQVLINARGYYEPGEGFDLAKCIEI